MATGKIRVIIKRPDEKYGHVTNISASLKNLQRTVEGYIEVVPIRDDIVVICNEDGKLMDLERNITITNVFGTAYDFVGTVIFAGTDGEEFADLPISFQEYKQMFQNGVD